MKKPLALLCLIALAFTAPAIGFGCFAGPSSDAAQVKPLPPEPRPRPDPPQPPQPRPGPTDTGDPPPNAPPSN